MFTGIVEEIGVVEEIQEISDGIEIRIKANKIFDDLKADDSVSCSGICLTVTNINKQFFTVQLVDETIKRTTVKFWKKGSLINLERALLPSTRMGGHLVQGHVDRTTVISSIEIADNSAVLSFDLVPSISKYIVEKGSICLDGISLTVAKKQDKNFKVAVIPHTMNYTNWRGKKIGDKVNVEVDIMAKYIENLMT